MANTPVSLASYKPNFGTSDGASPEYAIPCGRGYRNRLTLPANWDRTSFSVIGLGVASFASSDGKRHVLFEIRKDSDNYLRLTKTENNVLEVRSRFGGTEKSQTFTMAAAWAANTLQMMYVTFAGTIDWGYVQGGALVAGTSITSPGSLAAGTYTLTVGANGYQYDNWEGYANLIVTNQGGVSTPAAARFNSGNGQHFKDWAYTYFSSVVAYVNGDATTGRTDTYQGATIGAGAAGTDGRAVFGDATTNNVSYGNVTEFDAATKFTLEFEFGQRAVPAASRQIASRWFVGTNNRKQWLLQLKTDLSFLLTIATDLVGGTATVASAVPSSDRGILTVVYDGSLAAGSRISMRWRARNSTTRQYAASTDITSTITGTVPTALTTPASSTVLTVGDSADGGSNCAPMYVDDFRWIVGTAHSQATIDALVVNEPLPWQWKHAYTFESSANDLIGSTNGTVTGAAYNDDGRGDAGLFERYTKQGQYSFNGTSDGISLGSTTLFHGKSVVVLWGSFTPAALASGAIISDWDAAANKRVFEMYLDPAGRLAVQLTTDGTAGTIQTIMTPNGSIAVGTRYAFVFWYDGGQAGNTGRLKMSLSSYDPTTGTWSAMADQMLTYSGTVPAALYDPGSGVTCYFGRDVAGSFFQGTIDHMSQRRGGTSAYSLYQGMSIYSINANDAFFDSRWDFNGNANDPLGGINGTVTGAIQWYDGRQPVGWTVNANAGDEVDRATSSSDVQVGTYGIRVKNTTAAAAPISLTAFGSGAVSDLVLLAAYARETVADVALRKEGSGAFSSAKDGAIPTQGSLALCGRMDRATGAGNVTVKPQVSNSGAEAYLDALLAIRFAAVAFDVLDWHGAVASANCMFVYPNYLDVSSAYTPTLSGGSWRAALPLTNVQTTVTAEVARSTDATNASTKFVADLKAAWSLRALFIEGHNLSLNGRIRIRCSASSDGVTSPLYDTDWVLAYPPAYPLATLQTGHPAYSDRMLTAADWADKRNRYGWRHVIPTNVAARYWSFEFDDTANADGYVEIGRVYMGWAYQPTYNFKPGASIGLQTQTSRYVADDDTPYFDEHANIRPVQIAFDAQDYNEALVFGFDELMRKQGVNRQIGFVWDPTDEENLHRRSFLCTLQQLNTLQHQYTATEADVTFQLIETP